jgi:hypothetical protein
MLRVIFEILLPLVLPTVLYLAGTWIAALVQHDDAVRRAPLPWLWLAGAGVVLLAVMLVVVNIGFGTAERGVYVPPRWTDGHIVPGHVEPGP